MRVSYNPSMTYTITYADEVVAQDILALPKAMKARIQMAIETRLTVDPIAFGKPLRFALKGHRRLRVGDWRVVYRIDGRTVRVVGIKHRSQIYED